MNKVNKKFNSVHLHHSQNRNRTFLKIEFLASSISLALFLVLVSPLIVGATVYQPGQTLEPDCAPGTPLCGVVTISPANNLSDISNVATARTNLGLGTLAIQNGTFSGSFSGTSSGTNTGDQTTITGNAGTATALQTSRTINGVTFDGTGNITIASAAGTVTGTTLNSSVVNSSLTSVGTLANLTVTNPISGSVTGNAATVTTNANLTGAVTSLGNATSLGSFTSANLSGALTNETGTGAVVFGTAPTISSPIITNINPGADLTLTQNSVVPFTSVNSGAVANTLYLKNGNVGIGTTNPVQPLVVGGSQAGNAGWEIAVGSGVVASAFNRTTGLYTSSFYDSLSLGYRIAGTSGNLVQIGVSGTKILIGSTVGINHDLSTGYTPGSQSVTGYLLTLPTVTTAVTNTYKGNSINMSSLTSTGGGTTNFIGYDVQMPAITQTAGTLRSYGMRILGGTVTSGTAYALITDAAAGNVGINVAAPAQRLDVGGSIRQTGALNCALSSNASGDIICTSDANLKQNIVPFTNGLSVIEGITPSYFEYKGESYKHAGFIAQNVQSVLPEATPLQTNGYLGLDTNAILATTVNAIKELNLRVNNPKTLCVSDDSGAKTCITKTQLDALLAGAGVNSHNSSSSAPDPVTEPTTKPASESEVIPTPDLELGSTPVQEPTTEPVAPVTEAAP